MSEKEEPKKEEPKVEPKKEVKAPAPVRAVPRPVPPPVHIPVPVERDEEREMKWLRKAIKDTEAKIEKAKSDPNVVVTSRDFRHLDAWKRRLARLEKYA